MNDGPHPRALGLPLDRLFATYLAVAALALLFPHRPSTWPLLLAVHVLAAAVLWPLPAITETLRRASPRTRRVVRGIADWAPLLLVPVLYTELATLNVAVHDGRYFDPLVIRWEVAVFGGQPSREWAEAMPVLWLSEALHFAYLTYYFIVLVPPFLLYIRGRIEDFRMCAFAVMLSFFAHYLFFIYLPVEGPRYLFPPPGGEISAGYFYQLTHQLLEAGSSQGAAFPSSHVGVSVTQTLVMMALLPRLAPITGVLTAGLALGAIYGGFHYAIDALAGALLGGLAFLVARTMYARLARTHADPASPATTATTATTSTTSTQAPRP